MAVKDRTFWQSLSVVLSTIKKIGYVLLTLFMLFLAFMTYRYGGGFSDWKAIVVMITMIAMAILVGRIGFETDVNPFTRSTK